MNFDTLSCPSCAVEGAVGKLDSVGRGAMCSRCATLYPIAGGHVPCLVPEPDRFCLGQFRLLQEYMAVTETRQREIAVERRQPHLLELTRARLLSLIRAMDVERTMVAALVGQLTDHVDRAAAEAIPESPFSTPDLALLRCYEITFRDWAWGDHENERARAMVESLARQAGGASLGRLAVFGAGACRLAVDIHRTLAPAATFALDINPLPLLMADQIVRGHTVEVYEYPIGPRGVDGFTVLQRLGRSFEIPEGLAIVLADALRPPFVPGALDTVLTPWFIDAVNADLRETASIVNRVLRKGGTWLNQGPLRHVGPVSRSYEIEEVREIVAASGFEIVAESTDDVPYFDSPLSGSHRVETVYGFAGRKTRDTERVESPRSEPSWAVDLRLPIPRSPEIEATQERFAFNAGVISMIDGNRSLTDLAVAVGAALEVSPETLVEPLRAFVIKLLAPG